MIALNKGCLPQPVSQHLKQPVASHMTPFFSSLDQIASRLFSQCMGRSLLNHKTASHYPVCRLYVLNSLLLSLYCTPQVHPQAAGILPRQPPQKRRQCRPHCSHLRQAPGEEVQLLGGVAGAVRAGVGVSQLHGGVRAEPPNPHFGQGRHSHVQSMLCTHMI